MQGGSSPPQVVPALRRERRSLVSLTGHLRDLNLSSTFNVYAHVMSLDSMDKHVYLIYTVQMRCLNAPTDKIPRGIAY